MGKSENPYAFPLAMTCDSVDNPGMHLRDYFAGQAIAGVIRQCAGDTPTIGASIEEHFAAKAYLIAAAMLARRTASTLPDEGAM